MCHLIAPLLALFALMQQPAAAVPKTATVAPPPVAAAGETVGEQHVKLGTSTVDLTGPWKFQPGDNLGWAEPGLDDSSWVKMDLIPNRRGYVPGWTARGFAKLSGYAWYRLTVDADGANRRLALEMPQSADDAYQVFVNGKMVGEFGKFTPNGVTAYGSIPTMFPLPKDAGKAPIHIAIRMWMDSATPFDSPDAGGLHGPPEIGYADAIASEVQLNFDAISHSLGSGFLEMLILFMALLMAGALYWLDRSEKAYLWLAMVCAVTLLGNAVVLSGAFLALFPQTAGGLFLDVFAVPVRIALWIIFWGNWFRLARIRQLHFVVWTLAAVFALGTAMLRPPLYGQTVPVATAAYLTPALLVVKLALGVLLLAVAVVGFRRHKTEGWLAGVAVSLAFIANFQRELRLLHVQYRTLVLGYSLSLGTISTILSLLIITVILLRRFIASQRRQELWKLEIEQARQVQQILIPEKVPQVEGLNILSEYRPAREVGGDFFQVLPPLASGTSLIVVGDVTGKGLQAGMLVALIVGAVHTAAQHTSDPTEILAMVNDQLCDRDHSSATCMVLRIDRDGKVDLSHAGHLPPYLNGREMELEGALPLGTISGVEFDLLSFQLNPGDSLLLMSDGVVEAQDAQGQLFGFDRINEMLRNPMTPREIATAAQDFGQEDDILVLELQWIGVPQLQTP
jgi:hypothetical protein